MKGCDRSCGLFHPTLCNSSIDIGACYNPKCRLQHLLGTFRGDVTSSNSKGLETGSFQYRQSTQNDYNHKPPQPRGNVGYGQTQNISSNLHETQRINNKTLFSHEQSDGGINYNLRDFPPLPKPSSDLNDKKLNELSSDMKKMQTCMSYVMNYITSKSGESQAAVKHDSINPAVSNQATNIPPPFFRHMNGADAKNL